MNTRLTQPHQMKVIRGGGCYSRPDYLQGEDRSGHSSAGYFSDIGFRVVIRRVKTQK